MEANEQAAEPPRSVFHKARHIKYWLRCLKTLLPTAYTQNDSQRMTFAFFTLSALDLLSALEDQTTLEEIQGYVDWIYRCQHPRGGFKGFTGADGGVESCWDPANLAATFFALAALMVLGDGMERVKRRESLSWVEHLQRDDGSFGEALGRDGKIEGGGDIRYCYLAAAVRWILRRGHELESIQDIDVDGLVSYVHKSMTYEGGIGKGPLQEAHAGWTYCGIGALKLLGRLPDNAIHEHEYPNGNTHDNLMYHDLLRWLLSRQTLYIQEEDEATIDNESTDALMEVTAGEFQKESSYPAASDELNGIPYESIEPPADLLHCAGVNGRCNKVADTCYAFWVSASLSMLRSSHMQNFYSVRRYVLDKTQHVIGGFGKLVGDTPDILHSCLGLAALAIMKEPEVRAIDPMLCISVRARQDFEARRPIQPTLD